MDAENIKIFEQVKAASTTLAAIDDDTKNQVLLAVADAIAKKVRNIGGGLHYVKAMGVKLEERNQVQVSMNLVNYEKSAVYQAF